MVANIEHCIYCFEVLIAHLEGRKPLDPKFEDDHYPLFVTWNTTHHGHSRLRGCIGNFDPLPLHSGLKEYAITSAIHDRRFPPISIRELSHLTCGISLLTNFEDADNYLDWEVGVHGIWIEFHDDNNRRKTATYLPEVAEEQGWTKEEAIDELLRKGGYSGRITERVRNRVILTRYQSAKHVITYEEYLEYTGQKSSKQKIITTYETRRSIKSSKQRHLVDGLDLEDLN